jgi:hypothetical protein
MGLRQKILDIEKELARQYKEAIRCYKENAVSREEWELYDQTHSWFLTKIRKIDGLLAEAQTKIQKEIQRIETDQKKHGYSEEMSNIPFAEYLRGQKNALNKVLAVLGNTEKEQLTTTEQNDVEVSLKEIEKGHSKKFSDVDDFLKDLKKRHSLRKAQPKNEEKKP